MTFLCTFNRISLLFFLADKPKKCTQSWRLYPNQFDSSLDFRSHRFSFLLFANRQHKQWTRCKKLLIVVYWVHLESELQYKMLKCAQQSHNAKTKKKKIKRTNALNCWEIDRIWKKRENINKHWFVLTVWIIMPNITLFFFFFYSIQMWCDVVSYSFLFALYIDFSVIIINLMKIRNSRFTSQSDHI